MRLGLFGGTFDPVHYGHLILAELCREQCRLDQVWFLPAGIPPHKTVRTITAAEMRAEMLEIAVAGQHEFIVNRMEFERTGKTYTYQTLEQIHAESPGRELYFLIGGDSLADLPTWRKPQRIAELATIVAVNRGNQPLPEWQSLKKRLGEGIVSRLLPVSIPAIELSASDLRRRVSQGKSIRYMTPRGVEAYIAQHGLYARVDDSGQVEGSCEPPASGCD